MLGTILHAITNYEWLLITLLAVALLSGFYLSYRVTLQKSKHIFTAPIIFQFLGAIMILPLSLFSNQPAPFIISSHPLSLDLKKITLFILAGIFYAIHDRTQASVRKNVDVAISGVIDLSVHVFLIIFGIMLFREKLIFHQILGIILILLANFNVTYDFKKHKINKYLPLGLIANLAYALGILTDINISANKNLPLYIFFSYFVGGIYVFIISTLNRKLQIKQTIQIIFQDVNRKTVLNHLFTSFFSVYYTFAMLSAYRYGDIIITTTIISSTVIFSTMLSAIFLHEKKLLLLKISSAIIGVVGMILIVIG